MLQSNDFLLASQHAFITLPFSLKSDLHTACVRESRRMGWEPFTIIAQVLACFTNGPAAILSLREYTVFWFTDYTATSKNS